MVKEIVKGSGEIEADLLEIFMDNGTNQFEQKLLKSKRKLLNAKVISKISLIFSREEKTKYLRLLK
jgi:hypothetical protein